MSGRVLPAALTAAVVLVSGCAATPGAVEPGDATEAADHYRVEPQIEWTRMNRQRLELWTVDGPQLQQLRFYRAIEGGDTLLPESRRTRAASDRDRRPRYRDWMRPHDVMTLVADTLAQSGAVRIRTRELRPAGFGDGRGFRFELAFASQAGLRYRGFALGMIDEQRRLHLILYTGAEPHYYDAYRETVERIVDSIELL